MITLSFHTYFFPLTVESEVIKTMGKAIKITI